MLSALVVALVTILVTAAVVAAVVAAVAVAATSAIVIQKRNSKTLQKDIGIVKLSYGIWTSFNSSLFLVQTITVIGKGL
jgi:O-antigen/teichoic acid export membrane protein